MREIQFRVWDSYNKKMIPTEGGFSLGSADSEMVGGPDYPVMQYTGLKDKNGRRFMRGISLNFIHPINLGFKYYGMNT